MPSTSDKPLRLLIVCPSWVGDVVMATPALALVRRSLPGWFIGGLVRPGLDELLAGTSFFDELHVARSSGVMGPKFVAAKIRPRRYDVALLLTNSFSTALIARIAGIPRRIGYDRDARGLLLTDRLKAPTRADGSWSPVPAVEYYLRPACESLLGRAMPDWTRSRATGGESEWVMSLGVTREEEAAAEAILDRAGIGASEPRAILNPGGNNEAKRWPADRFARLARHLMDAHGLHVLINGSPAEAGLVRAIADQASGGESRARRADGGGSPGPKVVCLPEMGITLGALKALVRGARLMVTNDTGPRHVAAALGVRVVSLFGPTDHRWTTIPTRAGSPEILLLADPTLPADRLANDEPERCRIDRIEYETVSAAVDRQLNGFSGPSVATGDGRAC